MAEAWIFQRYQDRARGVVRDESGLLVCQDVSESDGDLIVSAPRLAEENEKFRAQVATLREALNKIAANESPSDSPRSMSDCIVDGSDAEEAIREAIVISRAALESTKEGT